MALATSLTKRVFHFNFRARTSRGLMQDKTSWFIRMWDDEHPDIFGLGECGPLPGLSVDHRPDLEETLRQLLNQLNGMPTSDKTFENWMKTLPEDLPSIRFALESAWFDLVNGGRRLIFHNSFFDGAPIEINGLIWMGDLDFTMDQINKKIAQGFTCIKLKVGGLDFDKECGVLQYIRRRYDHHDITLRLDANGAFKVGDALYKLNEIAKFKVHSIEQPIKPGLEAMEELCRKSPIPVAFDEELIGISSEKRRSLLEKCRPQFIVLKPSLHGGFSGCSEWISEAESLGIGWWITSALESNIGLNAICQFTANYAVAIPQGLGTGAIYEHNISSPLKVVANQISYAQGEHWDIQDI